MAPILIIWGDGVVVLLYTYLACFGLLGPAWVCLGLPGHAWACLRLPWPALAYLDLPGSVWTCLGLSGPAWACLGLSGPILVCFDLLGLSGPAWACLGLTKKQRCCRSVSKQELRDPREVGSTRMIIQCRVFARCAWLRIYHSMNPKP